MKLTSGSFVEGSSVTSTSQSMLSSSRSLLPQNDIVNTPRFTTRTLRVFRNGSSRRLQRKETFSDVGQDDDNDDDDNDKDDDDGDENDGVDTDEDDKEADAKGEEDAKVTEVVTEVDTRLLYWGRGKNRGFSSWI